MRLDLVHENNGKIFVIANVLNVNSLKINPTKPKGFLGCVLQCLRNKNIVLNTVV